MVSYVKHTCHVTEQDGSSSNSFICTQEFTGSNHLYSGIYRIKSSAGTSRVLIGFPVVSIIPSRQMSRQYVKSEKENFLPHPLRIIIY